MKKWSTIETLIHLETIVREVFIKKEHLIAVFYDLQKEYNTTWKFGTLKAPSKGNLTQFIENFLEDQRFQVHVGTTLLELQNQDGVPQGSVLLVTLSCI